MKHIRGGRPRIRLLSDVPTAVVIIAAVAAVVLLAAARRPEPWGLLSAEPAPVTTTATDDQPQPAATSAMRHVFHELHADGHHALCEVCGN